MLELLADLKKGIWTELPARKPIDMYRRNLQKSYVNTLVELLAPPPPASGGMVITFRVSNAAPTVAVDQTDILSVVRAHLASLRAEANAAAAASADPMTRYHLQDIVQRIDNALKPNK